MKNNLEENTECSIKPGRCRQQALPGIKVSKPYKLPPLQTSLKKQYSGLLNRKKLVFMLLFTAFTAAAGASIFAQTQPAPSKPEKEIQLPGEGGEMEKVIANPENLLGLNPSEIFEIIGAPESVYTMRGKLEWQDDVIFYYSTNLYLFFYDNRVWQVRGDYRFEGSLLGVKAGMEREKTRKLLGKPASEEKDEDIYLNPAKMTRLEKGFPVRMRLIFDQNSRISD
ncbi:MAG: hypothetical protein RBT69_10070, partial [Spirochaetia bacterium]|nr:hypothetical protein [Spirochaetia bacterium]